MQNTEQSVREISPSMATSSIQAQVSQLPNDQSSQSQNSLLTRHFQPYTPVSKEVKFLYSPGLSIPSPIDNQLACSQFVNSNGGYPPLHAQNDGMKKKSNARAAVKISHPETKEELKLDEIAKARKESSTRTHFGVQTQAYPVTYSPYSFMNYYPHMQLDPLISKTPTSAAVTGSEIVPAAVRRSQNYLGPRRNGVNHEKLKTQPQVANKSRPIVAAKPATSVASSHEANPSAVSADLGNVARKAMRDDDKTPEIGNSDLNKKEFQQQQDRKQSECASESPLISRNSTSTSRKSDGTNSKPLSSLAKPFISQLKILPHEVAGTVSIRVSGKLKYSKDFLLAFSSQFVELPTDFKLVDDTVKCLISSNLSALDGHQYIVQDGSMWIKTTFPSESKVEPWSFVGENFGIQNFHTDGRTGLLQPPMLHRPLRSKCRDVELGLRVLPRSSMQFMHKAERKYEVRKAIVDIEEAKQRRLKSILNKLTPQNFERLFQQVKEVNIDNTITLSGLISQIFYKALMEPTFCEMYASFCWHLAGVLPDFVEGHQKITFKRLLLNKCQEEFVRGEREEAEASKIEESTGGETMLALAKGKRAETRTGARRRMLGNIRLIGELYKKRMLTERVLRECINKLLGDQPNPDEEDIEALCKLMSTVGERVDHPKAKDQVDAYFEKMKSLSEDDHLSSRIRFMLKDVIDLRKNKWKQRQKVEKPKKIEELHSDAAQERRALVNQLISGSSFNSFNNNNNSRRVPGNSVSAGSTSAFQSPQNSRPMILHGFAAQGVRGLHTKHHIQGSGSVSFPRKSDAKNTAQMVGNRTGSSRKPRTRTKSQ
ncbi:OLC1v1025739C1 [Oldenlandia corymbosa var. corymbosa]|uniref:OLC1v1025739C1 n=1 Tax=Oldenlandia corymbosa var. corymbosa TaxID=529605 RepID=A0AAV1C8I6_OLDCO|nr:OLC1v1025739C1 [Oldenlandia corymbosa var. corymbosa]